MCDHVADFYSSNNIFSKAYTFNLRSGNFESCIKNLESVMSYGDNNEKDLFITRFCFEMMIRQRKDNKGINLTNKILEHFKDCGHSPLFTLVQLFVRAIHEKDFELFRMAISMYR